VTDWNALIYLPDSVGVKQCIDAFKKAVHKLPNTVLTMAETYHCSSNR